MDVKLHTRNVTLDDRFRDSVDGKVGHAARIFEQIVSADVEVTEEQNPRLAPEKYKIEITCQAAGHTVRIESAGSTPEAALDIGVARFEKQLRRLKDRMVRRSRSAKTPPLPDVVEEDDSDELVIVRSKQFVMKPMSPEEAVLQLELLSHEFFLFENANTDRLSLVYRRRDGAYGLIEPA